MPYALSLPLLLIALPIQLLQPLSAQQKYPTDYFQPPVDFRMLLSGTFGELRANHFHSGIDIKTGGVEGKPVYAVADGYVSRIKVSAFGFGKALYITHPNGFVSVYAHLKNYNGKISEYVFQEHYRKESFEIEMFPSAGELPVRKGDIIAYAGNSGTSGGPHLHFEIRDEATQKPVNPLLFGYEVKDFFRPRITSIKFYPEDAKSSINGSSKPMRILVEGWGEEHRLAGEQILNLSGNISFAIQTYDQQNDTDNKNGPYSVQLFVDSEEVYSVKMESFSFDQTRYLNSYIDYEEYTRNNARMQRTRIDPGNKLDIYGKVNNKGIFLFNDTLLHTIHYEVKDVAGNLAVLSFKAKSNPFSEESQPSEARMQSSTFNSPSSIFKYDVANSFETPSIKLTAPVGSFYADFEFRYDSARYMAGTCSATHKIHDKYTPIHDYITLAIKPDRLPVNLREKALIVKIKDDGKSFTSEGGQWEEDGYVRARIREFGKFSMAIDTVPPKIKPVSPEIYINLHGQTQIKFVIDDELSGIKSYRGTLNGKWILMDYDAKNNLLVYAFDQMILNGENKFVLEVIDGKNNRSVYQATLFK